MKITTSCDVNRYTISDIGSGCHGNACPYLNFCQNYSPPPIQNSSWFVVFKIIHSLCYIYLQVPHMFKVVLILRPFLALPPPMPFLASFPGCSFCSVLVKHFIGNTCSTKQLADVWHIQCCAAYETAKHWWHGTDDFNDASMTSSKVNEDG